MCDNAIWNSLFESFINMLLPGVSLLHLVFVFEGFHQQIHNIILSSFTWYHNRYFTFNRLIGLLCQCIQLERFNSLRQGRVTHICVGNLTIIGSDNGLSPGRCQAIYLNQYSNIVDWTPRNKLQRNLSRNLYIFIQENAFENVVWKLASILSRPQCVNNKTKIFGAWWVKQMEHVIYMH